VQRVDAGFDYVGGRIKIGLADLEVNDALALPLERAGFVQNLESGFRAQARHAASELQLVLGGLCHKSEYS
jgi:hypothetical protein